MLILTGLSFTPGLLAHLKYSETDTPLNQLQRGFNYILLYAFISEIARTAIHRILPPPKGIKLPSDDEHDVDVPGTPTSDQSTITPSSSAPLPTVTVPPPYSTERTPLLLPTSSVTEPAQADIYSKCNALIISGLAALVLAVVPGVQNVVFGQGGGLVSGTIGSTLGFLGAAFAVLDLLGAGGGLRFGDSYVSPST